MDNTEPSAKAVGHAKGVQIAELILSTSFETYEAIEVLNTLRTVYETSSRRRFARADKVSIKYPEYKDCIDSGFSNEGVAEGIATVISKQRDVTKLPEHFKLEIKYVVACEESEYGEKTLTHTTTTDSEDLEWEHLSKILGEAYPNTEIITILTYSTEKEKG